MRHVEPTEDYFTGSEAERKFGFHHDTFRRWSNAGKIEYIKDGGKRKYSVASIERFLNEKQPRKVKTRTKVQNVEKHQPAQYKKNQSYN